MSDLFEVKKRPTYVGRGMQPTLSDKDLNDIVRGLHDLGPDEMLVLKRFPKPSKDQAASFAGGVIRANLRKRKHVECHATTSPVEEGNDHPSAPHYAAIYPIYNKKQYPLRHNHDHA